MRMELVSYCLFSGQLSCSDFSLSACLCELIRQGLVGLFRWWCWWIDRIDQTVKQNKHAISEANRYIHRLTVDVCWLKALMTKHIHFLARRLICGWSAGGRTGVVLYIN